MRKMPSAEEHTTSYSADKLTITPLFLLSPLQGFVGESHIGVLSQTLIVGLLDVFVMPASARKGREAKQVLGLAAFISNLMSSSPTSLLMTSCLSEFAGSSL